MRPPSDVALPELVIEPGRGLGQYWRDLWRYRELFLFLAWRDLLVRYKQTVIGVAWSVIRPLLTMVVLTFVFGRVAKLPSEGTPYPILVFSAMLPWQFFASALSESSSSLITNISLISKVYFPRLAIPASAVVASFVDFLISFSILVVMMALYGVVPTWRMVVLPLFVLLAFGAAMGAGLWFAALNVKYRDFRYIVPFVIQFGLYISPVGFSSKVIPDSLRLLYSANPMVGVIDGFRWCILGRGDIYWPGVWLSVLTVVVVGATAVAYFRRTERTFADVI